MAGTSPRRFWPALDALGALLSALCAVHCVALPLVLLVLPFASDHFFEHGLLLVIGCVALLAVGGGALLHRRLGAFVPLGLGLAALFAAHTVGTHSPSGVLWSVIGSLLLITAHWLNARTCRASCEASAV